MNEIFPGSQQSSAAAHWNQWSDPGRRWKPKGRISRNVRLELLVPAVGGLIVLGFLIDPAHGVATALLLVGAVGVPLGIYLTNRHVVGLLIVLMIIEATTACWVVAGSDQKLGAIIRYPLGLVFCLPFLLMVWRSGILRQGGFRDYSIYLIWAFASSIYSLLPTVSFGRALAATLPFIALCAISLKVKNGQDARRAMGVLLTGCGVVVAINLVGLIALSGDVAWHPDPDTGMLRYNGIFTEPNEIGSLMLATLGAGFGYWPIAGRWKKVLAGAVMGCAIVLAVFADSRSPLAATAIGGFIYLLWRYRLKGIIGVAVLIALFYAVTFILPASHDYLDRGDVTSFTGRQVAWDFAKQSIKEHPLFGYGFEVEGQILLSQYFPGWDDVWSEGYQSSLHNGFLSRAVSLGIPGLLLWLFIISRTMLSLFFFNRDPWSLRSMALLSLLPVIVLNFTESVPDFRSFAGLEMGLAWALLERERLFDREQALQVARVAEADKSPVVRALQARPAG